MDGQGKNQRDTDIQKDEMQTESRHTAEETKGKS